MPAKSSAPTSSVPARAGATAKRDPSTSRRWYNGGCRHLVARGATSEPIEFVDLGAQRRRIGARMDEAIAGSSIMAASSSGPEVGELERQLAEFCGAKHVVSCANGTDALGLALMAKGAGPGQAMLVPSFTFAATAEVVAWFGATPVFVDVLDDTLQHGPGELRGRHRGGAPARAETDRDDSGRSVRPAGGLRRDPGDRRGQHGMWVICDAAQSFGASYKGRKVGTFGDLTTTSFFPAKPLGCYGDGGAVFLDDDETIAVLRSLRVHGQGSDKYDNVRIGMNARLDTMQAAVLLEKLAMFADEIAARHRVAGAL